MYLKISTILLVSTLFLTGCIAPPKVQKTALELQAIQVKEFETTHKIAFTSVMSVFQDLGYTISSASMETGLITAKSPTQQEMVPFVGQRMTDEKANAFVEQIAKDRTKIRLSFVKSIQTSSGTGMRGEKEIPLQEPEPYQNAFSKIQQSIFVKTNAN
jgi:hypothetical protein